MAPSADPKKAIQGRSPKQLREERAPLAVKIDELRKKAHSDDGWTSEDRTAWGQVNKDYDALSELIDITERADRVESDLARPSNRSDDRRQTPGREDTGGGSGLPGGDGAALEENRALALQAWARRQYDLPLTKQQKRACRELNFRPSTKQLRFQLLPTDEFRRAQDACRMASRRDVGNLLRRHFDRQPERRAAMSSLVGSTGGYFVPPETLVRQLEINMLAFGPMYQVADMLRTDTGEQISWPTADDTSNTGVQVGENQNLDNSGAGGTNPSIGKVYWNAYTLSSQAILVPYNLLRDSAFDVAAVIGELIGERLGRIGNTRYTTGTGASQAKGVVTCSTLGVTAASSTAITADEVIQLEHSVDPAYRMDAAYMGHDNTHLSLRLLKDGEGRYLWQSSFNEGEPDRLNRWPFYTNQDMASSLVSGAKSLLFGQFRRYKIRQVRERRVYRLEELYRATDQDGFIGLSSEDGNLLTAGTACMVHLLHP